VEKYNALGSSFRGKGQPNRPPSQDRGNHQNNGSRNFHNANTENFNNLSGGNPGNNSNFQQKPRPPNKGFRGGGN
jgi:hypothetical protein